MLVHLLVELVSLFPSFPSSFSFPASDWGSSHFVSDVIKKRFKCQLFFQGLANPFPKPVKDWLIWALSVSVFLQYGMGGSGGSKSSFTPFVDPRVYGTSPTEDDEKNSAAGMLLLLSAFTLDADISGDRERSHVHHVDNTETHHAHIRSPLRDYFENSVECGRKPEFPERTHTCTRRKCRECHRFTPPHVKKIQHYSPFRGKQTLCFNHEVCLLSLLSIK